MKLSVTEDQLREAYNKIVPVEDIKILKTKTVNLLIYIFLLKLDSKKLVTIYLKGLYLFKKCWWWKKGHRSSL